MTRHFLDTQTSLAHGGANVLVELTHADLTDGDASQVIELLAVKAMQGVKLCEVQLAEPFDASGDASIITTTVTVGDGDSATNQLASTELNPSGTEVFLKGGVGNLVVYTADDTVDATVACTSAKLLSDHDTGKLLLYFAISDASQAARQAS